MNANDPIRPVHWLAMAALALVAAFAFQGTRGLYQSTEGRYSEVAIEMRNSGNWIEPTLDGEPHWTKPPPTYWAINAGVSLLGRNAWGARLYLAVAFFATALAVAAIGATLWDRRTGLLAGIAYGTAPFAVSGANAVSTDTLLTLFETLAVLAYARAARTGRRAWTAAMWVAFGLAFGVKGPVALLPLLAILLWHRRAATPARLVHGPGMALGAVAAFWWFAVVIARHPDLLDYFVGKEIVARVATDEFHRHGEWYAPFMLYVPAIAFGALPWAAYAFMPLVRERLWEPRRAWARLRDRGPAGLFLLWIATSFVILSLSRSRLPLYVLPLMAPVALLAARAMARTPAPWGSLRRIFTIAAVVAALIAVGKGGASLRAPSRDMGRLWNLAQEVGAGSEGARLVSVDHGRLQGLRFYNGGQLDPLWVALPGEPVSEGQVASELARMFDEWPDARRIVFVEPVEKGIARWCAALVEDAPPARSARNQRWAACSVERRS